MKIIKGETLEKQMEHVDTILRRFSRRLHKTVVGVVPPCPISNYVQSPVDGVVLKYMFPTDGEITFAALYIENMPKSGVDVFVVVHFEETYKGDVLFAKGQLIPINIDMDVIAESRLTLTVKANKDEEQVSGIWVSVLWTPGVKDSMIKQFLIDELDGIGEENAKESA